MQEPTITINIPPPDVTRVLEELRKNPQPSKLIGYKHTPPCKAVTLRLRRLKAWQALLGRKPDRTPVYEVVEVLGGTQPLPGQTMGTDAVEHLIETGVKVTVV